MASFFARTLVPADQWVLLRAGVTSFACQLKGTTAVRLLVQDAADAAPAANIMVDSVAGIDLDYDARSHAMTYPTAKSVYARATYQDMVGAIDHAGS